ncbi:ankyrin repeat protein, partial [Reticulomyxa filosa]
MIIMTCFDIYLMLQTLLDWPRVLFTGKVRERTEEEESYERLRSLTELLCESIPQLVIQWFILLYFNDSAYLGITEQDLIRSIFASALNLICEMLILYVESTKFKVTYQGSQMYEKLSFAHYMFITMEGRFGFSTKLLSIQGGDTTVDLSEIEFRSDPFLVSNFIQATKWANPHERTLERIIISPNTVAGLTDANLKLFGDHCLEQKIRIIVSVPWKQWIRFQLPQEYALFVCDSKTGETALTYAVYMDGYDGKEWCERLLAGGADVNMKNRVSNNSVHASETPTYLAAFLKKTEYVKLFLEHGANVSNRSHFNRENKTPLFPACDSKLIAQIIMLLNHQVDVFAQDLEFGNTALKNSGWLDNAVCTAILTHETTRKQEQQRGMRLVNVANL